MENFRVDTSEVDIDLVQPNTWNPKDTTEENEQNRERFEQIKKGIIEHGFMMPVTVRNFQGRFEIIDGFHRYRACKELGYSKLLINNLGDVKDEVARSLTILFERAKVETNPTKEALLLKEIYQMVGTYEDMERLLPYSASVIQDKVELVEHDWGKYDKSGGEDPTGLGDDTSIKFSFTVDRLFADNCNKALAMAGENKDEAFITMCESYLSNNG